MGFEILGLGKGYHLATEGTYAQMGYLFCQKWYAKGLQGVQLWGRASQNKNKKLIKTWCMHNPPNLG